MWTCVLAIRKEVERILVLVAVIAMKSHAQLGERSLDEWRLHDDPRQSDVARGLQIDRIKRCRQVIGAITGTKLAESFRVGDGKFLVRAKSLDSIADLLGLCHAHRS